MRDYIAPLLQAYREEVKKDLLGKNISITFKTTPCIHKVFVVIGRYLDDQLNL
jgi:hypothetical protein